MNDRAWKWLRDCARKTLGDECVNCGRHARFPQVDHILPRSEFPELELDPHNVQILCPSCNRDKGTGVFSHAELPPNDLDQTTIRLAFIARILAELETRQIALTLIEQAQRQKRSKRNV